MTFVQSEITAEAVVESMLDDSRFAHEMWMEIAHGLRDGMLFDDTCDLLRSIPVDESEFITQQIKNLCDNIRI